jgi:RimJ/RimL family protein N-acetyltransferase
MTIRLRDLRPGEHATVQAVFDGLSTESRHRRFHGPVKQLTPGMLEAMSAVDGHDHVAVVAEAGRGRRRRPVGLARLVRTEPGRAELAVEVVDLAQGCGVGRRLVQEMKARATRMGLREVEADVLHGNEPMLHLLRDVFTGVTAVSVGNRWELRCPVPTLAWEAADLVPFLPAA